MDLRMRAKSLILFMKLPIQSLLNLLKVFKLFLNLPGEPLKSLKTDTGGSRGSL